MRIEQNYVLTRIREMLDQRNWSLYKLSQETGIPYSSLNSLFQKNNQPTITTLEKICAGFHISMSQFFEENISDVPVCDFTDEEIETTMKIRTLSAHDRRILLSLLDAIHNNDKDK